jgi:uncharacterized protein (DUF1499 family)
MTETSAATFSTWTPRLALFGGALAFSAVLLHRLFGMPTPVALNLMKLAFALAGIALLLGIVALIDIWRRGRSGTSGTLAGMAVALAMFVWPLTYLPALVNLPEINDVTTDLDAPPRFVALAKLRSGSANGLEFPKQLAKLQAAAYPDLKPLLINRSSAEAFELALEAVKRLRFQVVAEEPPVLRPEPRPGWIEAVDRTLVVGFYDDVVIRIDGDQKRARIDVRSASRYGRHDLGTNASRTRVILKEIQARFEATVPAGGARIGRLLRGTPVLKRPKGADQKSAGRGTSQAPAQSDAQRAPAPKAKPR